MGMTVNAMQEISRNDHEIGLFIHDRRTRLLHVDRVDGMPPVDIAEDANLEAFEGRG